MKKAKKVRKAKKSKKKDRAYFGYVILNDKGRYERVEGYFWSQEDAARHAVEFLKNHPTWTTKVVEHRVLQTVSFDLTPVLG